MRFLDRFKDLIRFNQPQKVSVATVVGTTPASTTVDLTGLKVVELKAVAKERGLKGYSTLKRTELLTLLSE